MTKIDLLNGDCLELMKGIPDESIDLVLTDPPYGTTQNKWDSVIPFEPMWEQLGRITKKNSAVVLFGSQPFTSALGASNISHLRYSWIWLKSRATGHLNAKRMPMANFEDILVFYIKQPRYNPQGLRLHGKVTKRGNNGGCYGDSGKENLQEYTNYPRRIIEFSSESKTMHPTQKPVELMEYLVRTYSNEGDTVLDFTMGSGTTGIACKNLERSFIGIELDEETYRKAKERIENHKGHLYEH